MDLMTGILFLTLNVYHEARSEDQLSQMAVAHVTLNRARMKRMSIKDVVYQPYQFSWTHQKQGGWQQLPKDIDAYMVCLESASTAARGFDFTNGATHYHRNDVIPEWTNRMQYLGTFGVHHFYKRR